MTTQTKTTTGASRRNTQKAPMSKPAEGLMGNAMQEAVNKKAAQEQKAMNTPELITEDRLDSKTRFVTKQQFDAMVAAGIDTTGFEVRDQVEEARKKKLQTLEERASEYLDGFMEPLELFEPLDAMKKLTGMGWSAMRWHYIARQQAERAQARLDTETSGTTESPLDHRISGMEIDPVGTQWDLIQSKYAQADAEHVYFLMVVQAQARLINQCRDDAFLRSKLIDAALSEGISEKGYIAHCEKEAANYAQRVRQQNELNRQTAQIDYSAQVHLRK